jgi:hypothetical protein
MPCILNSWACWACTAPARPPAQGLNVGQHDTCRQGRVHQARLDRHAHGTWARESGLPCRCERPERGGSGARYLRSGRRPGGAWLDRRRGPARWHHLSFLAEPSSIRAVAMEIVDNSRHSTIVDLSTTVVVSRARCAHSRRRQKASFSMDPLTAAWRGRGRASWL